MRRLIISSKSAVNGLSSAVRRSSVSASSGEAVAGMGASTFSCAGDVVRLSSAGDGACLPLQAVTAVATSRATTPRQAPACVRAIFIIEFLRRNDGGDSFDQPEAREAAN